MKTISIPNPWLKDWNEIKKHVILNPSYNDATIYKLDSDSLTLAALMVTYRAERM